MKRSSDPVRWGILGTGKIAGRFAEALARTPRAALTAVGSRDEARARIFAEAGGAARAYGSYEEVAADPEIDVVYVATPHVLHAEHALLCLDRGKAVLCEKPFALNAGEARAVFDRARERRLFVMEAMWMRFIPVVDRMLALVRSGAIGEVRLVSADFGFRAEVGPEHRLLDPALGGGALLDIGIYPVTLAQLLLGRPATIVSHGQFGNDAVDRQGGVILGYDGGRMAVLYSSIDVHTPVEATVMGTRGRIRLHRRFHHASRMTIVRDDGPEEEVSIPVEGNGLQYEAEEVIRCLDAGRLESEGLPHAHTLAVLETLDTVRAQWGLQYPAERRG